LCAKQRRYAIHNTTIGLVNNGCLALELAKKQDKTGYDFHSRCLRNQSMYAVIARSIVYSGDISHFFSDTGVVHVGAGPVPWAVSRLQLDLHLRTIF
jgi:hypothetical protein